MADVYVKFGADASELVAAAKQGQAGIASVATASAQAAAPLKNMGTAMNADATEAQKLANNLNTVASAERSAASEAAAAASALKDGAGAASEASAAHSNLTSGLGNNRIAMMELGHSARAMVDGMVAGISPMRVMAMEAPRLAQVLTELGPGAMAALVSPAAAAAAGVGVLAAGLGYLAYQAISAKQNLDQAKQSMALAGDFNPAAVKEYADHVKHLGEQYSLGAGDAREMAIELEKLQGPARERMAELAALAGEYAKATGADQAKATEAVVKAANEGPEALARLSNSVSQLTEEQKANIQAASAGHNTLGAFDAVIKASTDNWGKLGEAIAATSKRQKEYDDIAESLAAAGVQTVTPEQLGSHAPDADAALASQRAKPDAATEQAKAAEADYNKVLIERASVLADIKVLEGDVAKASDPAQRAAAEQALGEARLRATNLHTEAENESYQRQIADIHAEAAAAAAGSQQKIDALKKEQEAIRERNTVRDATGKVVVDGADSAAYAEAGARIEGAEREHQAKLYQLQAAGIQQRQAAARDDLAQQIALQQQLVALASKRGEQDPMALAEAQRRLTDLQRQEADKRVANTLDALKHQLADDATTTEQREALLHQYSAVADQQLNHNSDAYRAATDYVRDETARLSADRARAAIADLEVERRTADQKEAADLRQVERRQELDQLTAEEATRAEQSIVSAHDLAVTQILTAEEKAAGKIINLAEEVARRKREVANQEAVQQTAITNRTADLELQKQRQVDQQIARLSASTLAGILTGRMTFAQAAGNIAEQLLEREIEAGIESLLAHDSVEAGKTTATSTGVLARLAALITGTETGKAVEASANATSVMGSAYKAAAGAYAALAGIPIIGPVLGAAAAVATFAAVSAYNVFSAKGGMERVPYDGAMAELHKDEMVLPSYIASPLRAQLAGGATAGGFGLPGTPRYGLPGIPRQNAAANSNLSSAAGGQSRGDIHVHIHPGAVKVEAKGRISVDDLSGLDAALERRIAGAVRTAHRKGHFS